MSAFDYLQLGELKQKTLTSVVNHSAKAEIDTC